VLTLLLADIDSKKGQRWKISFFDSNEIIQLFQESIFSHSSLLNLSFFAISLQLRDKQIMRITLYLNSYYDSEDKQSIRSPLF
jgi:hypothetical protein